MAFPLSGMTTSIAPPRLAVLCGLSLLLLSLAGYAAFFSRRPDASGALRRPLIPGTQYQRFHEIFLNSSENATLSSFLRSLTLRPHVAGTPEAEQTLRFVVSQLRSSGLRTHVAEYQALLSYPKRASLSLQFGNGSSLELSLREAGAPGSVVAPYHAYSPSGEVAAPAVFVNYGREKDYRSLEAVGVGVRGCVAVARRGGGVSRGAAVRRAEREGAAALLLYSDGPERRGVERGTVMSGVGDPQTPGWAGLAGGERLPAEDRRVTERFPGIPSMPISAASACAILSSIEGQRLPQHWPDGHVSAVCNAGAAGMGPTLVKFSYKEEKKIVPIKNIFATIRGYEEPDRYVILGNHRDAWTFGAVDPNSGTAALLDIARRFGHLLKLGWKPRRTIVLCSWDAEEFGMIGSTEWVEQNHEILGSKGVAYLNVDCAVQGPGFFARATPQLDDLLVEVTKAINDPDSEGMTVYQSWIAANGGIKIGRLGESDSDYAPFVQHVGVPSVDIYYGRDYPVYHTGFDSYGWVEKYGDPLFHRHLAVTGIWGLLALRLVDDTILSFNYLSYGAQLKEQLKSLHVLLDSRISLDPIQKAIQELISAATTLDEAAKKPSDEEQVESLEQKRQKLNDRLMLAERGFLEAEGLGGRLWFKHHLVYGPPIDYESKLSFFPGIADAMSRAKEGAGNGGQLEIQHEIWRVARAIQRAAIALRGELS